MWMLQREHSGDGCVLALTLCKVGHSMSNQLVVPRCPGCAFSSRPLACGVWKIFGG